MTIKIQHVTFVTRNTFRIYVFHQTQGVSYFVSYPVVIERDPMSLAGNITELVPVLYIGHFDIIKPVPVLYIGHFETQNPGSGVNHLLGLGEYHYKINSPVDITPIIETVLGIAETSMSQCNQNILLSACEGLLQVQEDMQRGDIVLPKYNPELRKGAIDA